MRWLTERFRSHTSQSQRGATAVMTAILMVVLLAFAAIAIDVGMMYSERAQLQNGADAAALAIAQDCSSSRGCGDYTATARSMANGNANDKKANVSIPVDLQLTNRRVTVNVSSKNSSDGSFINLVFANVFGQEKATIGASATAVWTAPTALSTVPWTFSKCALRQELTNPQWTLFDSGNPFSADPSGKHIVIRSDNNYYSACDGSAGYANGGFAWLDLVGSSCVSAINAGANGMNGAPGKSMDKKACESYIEGLMGTDMLIPIFSSSSDKGGSNATYTLHSFAVFRVTGWNFPGISQPDTSPGAPKCKGSCSGFIGYFKGWVTIEEYQATHSGSSSKTVRLIK